jgi:hypothetical protein
MKARFKSILLSAFGVMAAFSAVTYTSCNNDKCKAIVCAYGGVCNEGTCVCPSGYEGSRCETLTRERYMGVWQVLEDGTVSNAAQYAISVEAGPKTSDLVIKNFYNSFMTPVNAYVKGDTLYIPQQDMEDYQVQGIGYIAEDKYYGTHGRLTVRYQVTNKTTNLTDDFGLDEGDPSLWNK